MRLKRRIIEENYRKNQVIKNTELTYYYDNVEEYNQHSKKMKKEGYVLEGYTVLNLGDSEADRLVPAAQYSKRERIEFVKENIYEKN